MRIYELSWESRFETSEVLVKGKFMGSKRRVLIKLQGYDSDSRLVETKDTVPMSIVWAS